MKKDHLPKITIRGEYFGNRTLPSLNDYLAAVAKNPKAGNKFKSDYQKPILSAIRRCLRGWVVEKPPIILHYRFYEVRKGKRRDRMNIFACADKFVEDALQIAGVIKDDNPDWIENTTHEFYWLEEKDAIPYVEILIEEKG